MSRLGRVRVGLASVLLSVLALSAGAETDLQSDCQWAVEDPERVVRACTALIAEEKPPQAWMHFNRGLAFKLLGRLKEAERDYTRAIALDARKAAAYTNRGNVRLLLNDVTGALADYRKAIRLDPNDAVARENLRAIEAALRKVGADKSGRGVTSDPAR